VFLGNQHEHSIAAVSLKVVQIVNGQILSLGSKLCVDFDCFILGRLEFDIVFDTVVKECGRFLKPFDLQSRELQLASRFLDVFKQSHELGEVEYGQIFVVAHYKDHAHVEVAACNQERVFANLRHEVECDDGLVELVYLLEFDDAFGLLEEHRTTHRL